MGRMQAELGGIDPKALPPELRQLAGGGGNLPKLHPGGSLPGLGGRGGLPGLGGIKLPGLPGKKK